MRWPPRFLPASPWPPPASAGLPLPFSPAVWPSLRVGRRGRRSGLARPRPLTPSSFSSGSGLLGHRLALRGPRVSQRVGAGTCSRTPSLRVMPSTRRRAGGSGSTEGRGTPHPTRGPTLEPPRWPSMGSSEPLLQPHLPILLITSSIWKNAPWDLGVSVLFPTAFPLPLAEICGPTLPILTDSRLLLVPLRP